MPKPDKPTTVQEYLAKLPPDRRAVISKVRALVRKNLPAGYRESLGWGAITWAVPLSIYPDTYNGQPLCYAALAAQKNYNSLYLMAAYGDPRQRARLEAGFKKAGKRLNMGKSCVRFETLDDLPLATIASVVRSIPMKKYVEFARTVRERAPRGRGK